MRQHAKTHLAHFACMWIFISLFNFPCFLREDKNQDNGRKRSKRGKEVVKFKTDSRQRSQVLHQRRKGLFQSGFKKRPAQTFL